MNTRSELNLATARRHSFSGVKAALRALCALGLVGGMLAVVNCGDTSPTMPRNGVSMISAAASISGGSSGQHHGFLACSANANDEVDVNVGPEGGVVAIGSHALVIPPGALQERTRIRARITNEDVNRIRFKPEGLQFARPAWLIMSYANCGGVDAVGPKHVDYVSPSLDLLSDLESFDDAQHQIVYARLHHFSDYIVSW